MIFLVATCEDHVLDISCVLGREHDAVSVDQSPTYVMRFSQRTKQTGEIVGCVCVGANSPWYSTLGSLLALGE